MLDNRLTLDSQGNYQVYSFPYPSIPPHLIWNEGRHNKYSGTCTVRFPAWFSKAPRQRTSASCTGYRIVSPGSLRRMKAPPMLKKLCLLLNKYHIDLKIAITTYNILTILHPTNLSSPITVDGLCIATSSTFGWRQCARDTKRQDHHRQLRVQVCGSVGLERFAGWTLMMQPLLIPDVN